MDLVGDERGQSVQIGAVLLFGVLIITFSIYQAFVVPNQNREVEFNHNQQVQRDMIELRNTLLETYTGGNDGYTEVTLGTNYPARVIASNPSPPGGSLRTRDARSITIVDQDTGDDITTDVCPGSTVETRFLEYEPSYSVYDGAGTLRYENSLLYHDFGTEAVTLTDQTLVRGDDIQIIPVTRELNVGGTQTVAVEPKAGLVDTTEVENVQITLPTRLSQTRWEAILSGEVDAANIAVSGTGDSRTVELTPDGTYTLACGPVGIGEVPPSGERGGGIDEINPAAPGDIALVEERRNSDTMELDFENRGGTNSITEARINFYEGNPTPSTVVISEDGEPDSGTLQVRGDFVQLDPDITLDGDGETTTITLQFDTLSSNNWFILTVVFETGEQGLYFVPT